MRCKEIKLDLPAYLSGELKIEKMEAVSQHLLNCSSCARELLRLKKLEQQIKEGLECWAQEEQDSVQLSAWLGPKACNLNRGEIEEKKKWVASLFNNKDNQPNTEQKNNSPGFLRVHKLEISQKEKDRKPGIKGKEKAKFWRGAMGLVACLLVAFMLTTYWPQAVRASSRMPLIGPWVRELVLKDAGLNWAYENGYIQADQASVQRDGVSLTVLGVVADPVQTTVIYLVDGLKNEFTHVAIRAVNGEGVASWFQPGIDTPLGRVGFTQAKALTEGDHELTVTLLKGGNLAADLEVNVFVKREENSRLSQSYALDYEVTVDGITVQAERAVYTPTQVMVEYTVSGGGNLEGLTRPEHALYLLTPEGEKLNSVMGGGSMVGENRWELQQIFNRPAKIDGLKMVIPALGRFEEINLEFSPAQLGRTRKVLNSALKLEDWVHHSGGLKVKVGYQMDGLVQALRGWSVVVAGGGIFENPIPGQEWGWADESFVYSAYLLTIKEKSVPVKAIAKEAQLIIEGHWEIDLPAAYNF